MLLYLSKPSGNNFKTPPSDCALGWRGGFIPVQKFALGWGGGIFLVQFFWPKDLFWPWGPHTHYTNYETWTCTSKTKVILDYFWPIYCTFDFFTIFHSNLEEKIYFIAPIVILEKGRDIYWVKNIKPHQIYQWQRRKSKLYLLQPAPRVKHQIWACHKHPAYILGLYGYQIEKG